MVVPPLEYSFSNKALGTAGVSSPILIAPSAFKYFKVNYRCGSPIEVLPQWGIFLSFIQPYHAQPRSPIEMQVVFLKRIQHRPLLVFPFPVALLHFVSLCLCLSTWIVGGSNVVFLLSSIDCYVTGAQKMSHTWLSEWTALRLLFSTLWILSSSC